MSTAIPARWAVRIIYYRSVIRRVPGWTLEYFILAQAPDLLVRLPFLTLCDYYSTTKGADCAITCFEMASFTFTVTLYLPGGNPARGMVFSTVS